MSPHRDIDELQRCLDEGREPSAELARRIEADPRLRRRSRALRSVDRGLAEELAALAHEPAPEVAARVVGALEARRRRSERREVARPLALAAAAALAAWLAWPVSRGPSAAVPPREDAAPAAIVLRWPVALEAPAPEAALLEEARRLAEDTRGVARSLWSSLPLAGWATRAEQGFPH
jgi:hypothetical protein